MGKKKGKSKKSGKKKGGSAAGVLSRPYSLSFSSHRSSPSCRIAGPAQPLKVCKLCVQPYIALKDPERTLCHLCFMFEMNKPKFEDPTPRELKPSPYQSRTWCLTRLLANCSRGGGQCRHQEEVRQGWVEEGFEKEEGEKGEKVVTFFKNTLTALVSTTCTGIEFCTRASAFGHFFSTMADFHHNDRQKYCRTYPDSSRPSDLVPHITTVLSDINVTSLKFKKSLLPIIVGGDVTCGADHRSHLTHTVRCH